jgi:general secretion pathway protein H
VAVRFDLTHRRFGIGAPSLAFARGIEVAVESPAANVGEIRFFPDGSASGGAVELGNRSGAARLTIDWLTGAVERAR